MAAREVPKFASFAPKRKALQSATLDSPPRSRKRARSRKPPAAGQEPSPLPDRKSGGRHRHHSRHEDELRRQRVNSTQSDPRHEGRLDKHSNDHQLRRERTLSHHDLDIRDDPETDEVTQPPLWIVDVRGDKDNLTYESLHKYSVPAYYRAGSGHVVGTPQQTNRIDREQSTDTSVVLTRPFEQKGQKARPSLRLPGKAGQVVELDEMLADAADEATKDPMQRLEQRRDEQRADYVPLQKHSARSRSYDVADDDDMMAFRRLGQSRAYRRNAECKKCSCKNRRTPSM